MTQAVSRYWHERAQGRVVSIDDVIGVAEESPDFKATRATAIRVIASQAAVLSSGDPQAAADAATVIPGSLFSSVAGVGVGGPLPKIDGYDLVSCLGRGGMGAVFEGYQQSTGRRVAIKFMLDEVGDSGAARQRFEREAEVVARLQHPGIVSIIDSGVRKGRYFYVMEYVPGKMLDDALPPGECDPARALRLIAEVCDAVDYAHQRGVLHRDLKPSNVIVDAAGTPHLLDFGLAKTFDPSESDGSSHGALGLTISGPDQLLGTVAYMSPEQALGRHDETSVRTDVYALGAIAYELITGRLPCRATGSLRDVLARIAEEDPPPLSTLRKRLSRDLDAVLLKSLEKSPDRRYATAGEFAADIRRLLAGEPVVARRVGPMGRSVRWVRRNRSISAVIAAAVLTIMVVSGIMLGRIVRERNLAMQNFALLRSILESADPEKSTGVTVLQLLDGAGKRMDAVPPEQDLTEAEVREILGTVYRKFGAYDRAVANQIRALQIRERHASGDDPAVADALHNLAATLWWDGRYEEAEGLYTRSLDIRKRIARGDSSEVAMSLTHLAACRLRMGRPAEARQLYTEALDMRKRMYGAEHEEVAQSINNLARCSLEAGRFDEAQALFSDALAMIRRLKGDVHAGTAAASQNLGDCLLRKAETLAAAEDTEEAASAGAEARAAFERAMSVRKQMYTEGHHLVAVSMNGLARAELYGGNAARALELAKKSVEMLRATRRADHPDLADALETLALAQLRAGDLTGAESSLRESAGILVNARPRNDAVVGRVQGSLGLVLTAQHDWADAETALTECLRLMRSTRGEASPEVAQARRRLVALLTAKGEPARAEQYKSDSGPVR